MEKQSETIDLRRFVIANVVERMVLLKGDDKKICLKSADGNCCIDFLHKSSGGLSMRIAQPAQMAEQKLRELLSETGLQEKYSLQSDNGDMVFVIADSNCYIADELAFVIFTRFFDLPESAPLELTKTHSDYDCRPVIAAALAKIKEVQARGIELFYPADMVKLRVWEEEQSYLMELHLVQLSPTQKEKAWEWFIAKGWSCYDHDTGSFLQAEEQERYRVDKLEFRFNKKTDYVAMYALSFFMEVFGVPIETYFDIRYLTWYEPIHA